MKTLFQKILVPYDFSRSADDALAVAVEMAAKHRGALLVMHAIPPLYPIHGRPVLPAASEITEVGRQVQTRVAAAVKGRRLPSVKTWVMVGPPAGCILEAARKADAIVMGTLGRTGLPHLLLGSVAERIVRHAQVPVLTVRTRARGKH
jgi:universal stress protein A